MRDGRQPVRGSRRRRGVVALEFVVVFPLMVIVTLGVFEFGFFALVQQTATTATVEAARHGARILPDSGLPLNDGVSNADPDDEVVALQDVGDRVALVAEQFLAVQQLEVEPTGSADNDANRPDVRVRVERRVGSLPTETADRGDTTIALVPVASALRPNEIRVTVAFRLVNPTPGNPTGSPVPDWLTPFGFTWGSRTFQLSSRAGLE
jgi:hypothetical protein